MIYSPQHRPLSYKDIIYTTAHDSCCLEVHSNINVNLLPPLSAAKQCRESEQFKPQTLSRSTLHNEPIKH